jgi:hypothetical protein
MEARIGDALVAPDPAGTAFLQFNPVAASVWGMLDQPRSFDELRDGLLADYDVGTEECSAELRSLLHVLIGKGLVEEWTGTSELSGASQSEMPGRSRQERLRGRISAEFALLVDICASAFPGARPTIATDGEIDWSLFLKLTCFHRVQGLVWRGLSKANTRVPDEVSEAIATEAANIATANLRAAVESQQLLASFESAGMAPLFVKGLTLGALAYGDPAIKSGVDIDLLVRDDELEQAAELLQRRGYRLVEPAGPYQAERLRKWHGPAKESTWVRDDPVSLVDLHSRLSDHPRLIPAIGSNSTPRIVEVSKGIRLPTLPEDELFAYLCVHGASSAWFRLKWITDLAALLDSSKPLEIDRLYERSQELGAARAADQALLLADRLYDTLVGDRELRESLLTDSRSRWLCNAALHQLAGAREPVEPTARRWGTARIHLTQFFLVRGLAFKASELVRQARKAIG